MREQAKRDGRPVLSDGRWRDRYPAEAPPAVKPVIRFKAPREGQTVLHDLVQGAVTVANSQLDDLIILRSDGSPTYNLSVVVDDHDMGVSHVIRGDDHLTNAFRQNQLYLACDWPVPAFAHIPLIHGPDGAKLSKRHGALGVDAYRDMGYLPAAMRNYLLRLGWSHGDAEVIPTEQAIAWFDLANVGRSPARFDFAKLNNLNSLYLRQLTDIELVAQCAPFLEKLAGRPLEPLDRERLHRSMPALKERAKTLVDLADAALYLVIRRPLAPDAAAAKLLDADGRALLGELGSRLAGVAPWTAAGTEAAVRAIADERKVKLGKVAQPLRAAVTGRGVSPPIFEVLEVLGRDESLGRIEDAAG